MTKKKDLLPSRPNPKKGVPRHDKRKMPTLDEPDESVKQLKKFRIPRKRILKKKK